MRANRNRSFADAMWGGLYRHLPSSCNVFRLGRIAVGAIAIMFSSAAMANVFTIRAFETNQVIDLFNDGTPPPIGPDGTTIYYSVSAPAAIGPEQNVSGVGGLTITPGLGNLASSTTGDILYRAVGVSPFVMFTQDSAFTVIGVYDDIVPAHDRDYYAIRLQNFGAGGGTEVLTFGAFGTPTGMHIALYDSNFLTHTVSLLGEYVPTVGDLSEPQLGLLLSHNTGENFVTASFCFFDINVSDDCSLTDLVDGPLFRVTTWTVPAFNAAQVVPEPGTIALLTVAVAGLGFSRRRKLH